jgi:hypothetical protein
MICQINYFNVLHPFPQDYLHLHISDTSTSWHSLFGAVEQMKTAFPNAIEDYSVSETTLEQVFLSFAKRYNRKASEDTSNSGSSGGWKNKLTFW